MSHLYSTVQKSMETVVPPWNQDNQWSIYVNVRTVTEDLCLRSVLLVAQRFFRRFKGALLCLTL